MSAAEQAEAFNEAALLSPGMVFHGVYEVLRCIKAGGMGAVYEVLQRNTQRRRALKVMLPSFVADHEMRERFKQEATVAAGIDSEHIVETLDAGVDAETGIPFIVMELLKGQELGSLLREQGAIAPEEVLTLLHQVGLALDKTAAAGIVHRDLKPENIFITRRDDGAPRAKVLDFGVAKIVAENTVIANATKSVGSPLYMAPEQIQGDQRVTPRADLYSLAHMAYTMLVGQAYWVHERRSMPGLYGFLVRVMDGAQVPASERASLTGGVLPPAFDIWFAKAAARYPSDRFQSAAVMIGSLADALSLPRPGLGRGSSPNLILKGERTNPTIRLDKPDDYEVMIDVSLQPSSSAVRSTSKPSIPPPPSTPGVRSRVSGERDIEPMPFSSVTRPKKSKPGVVASVAAGIALVGLAIVLAPRLFGGQGGPSDEAMATVDGKPPTAGAEAASAAAVATPTEKAGGSAVNTTSPRGTAAPMSTSSALVETAPASTLPSGSPSLSSFTSSSPTLPAFAASTSVASAPTSATAKATATASTGAAPSTTTTAGAPKSPGRSEPDPLNDY